MKIFILILDICAIVLFAMTLTEAIIDNSIIRIVCCIICVVCWVLRIKIAQD